MSRRETLHPEAAAWPALEARWGHLVNICRDTIKLYGSGKPMNSVQVEAAREIVKVADQVLPGVAWRTAVAVCMMHEAEPRRFASEASFRVQLGRRVRHLAETNRGRYWNPGEGRYKLVFRDPSPRAAFLIGDLLATTFGVAGVYFAGQDQAEIDAKAAERRTFYEALHEVTPAMKP